MIQAESFIEAARKCGFNRYAGVPCSFLTPLINYVINDETLNYISSANEGDAVATGAGSSVGGQRAVVMMQNSGFGNAVSPLTSLCHTFRIPVLLITTLRGDPGLSDEPQHELMGKITGSLYDTMQIPWEFFPTEEQHVEATLTRVVQHFEAAATPYGLIMRKDSVASCKLIKAGMPKRSPGVIKQDNGHTRAEVTRQQALDRIVNLTPARDYVVIATTGYTGRELYATNDRENQLYMVGSMGCASSLALGLSLARSDLKIVVIDGDGAALMRMGNLATLGTYAGKNLVHILLDNEVHDSTGGQATVAGNVDFASIAHACGYAAAYSGSGPGLIDEIINHDEVDGARFLHLKIKPGTRKDLPRPDTTPDTVVRRLMAHIQSGF